MFQSFTDSFTFGSPGQSPTGLIFESAWANFVINLLMFVLASHVVGPCWYLFGLQRVNQCLRNACHNSNITRCMEFIDCGHDGPTSRTITMQVLVFNENAVELTTRYELVTRYVYSLFWGFQKISTLAGNQVLSYFLWEVIFIMAIMGVGLLLLALLIGNMQNFLQSLGRRCMNRLIGEHLQLDEFKSHGDTGKND
ncbi:hypothetical protein OROGR_032242 [Orobanche gracilis]